MEYWLWGLYAFMTVLCLRSLYVLMQRHRMTHQYNVVLKVRSEMKEQAGVDQQQPEAARKQQAA